MSGMQRTPGASAASARALVASSSNSSSRHVSAVRTKAAPAPQHAAVRESIKMAPSSRTSSSSSSVTQDAPPTGVSRTAVAATKSKVSAGSGGPALALTRKVDDVFKRMQPHTIVQSYEKLLTTLQIVPSLRVNGEVLTPLAVAPTSLTAGWKAAQRPESESLPGTFDPPSGRFHYARSLQYAPTDAKLSLSAFKALDVSFTSAMHGARSSSMVLRVPAPLTAKHWRLTATSSSSSSSSKQLGLALYELSLGAWQHSSVVALVWTKTLEVARLYLQLNIAELLYACVERPLAIPFDDIDPLHGLHSYTVAVTIRTFESVLWEREVYDVAFTLPSAKTGAATVVSVELLDDSNSVYRDRERYLRSSDAALPVTTDALAFALDTALVVDVNVWERSTCAPVWGCSKPLAITRTQPGSSSDNNNSSGADFSLSGAERKQRLVLQHTDTSRNNAVTITLETLASSSSSGSKTRVFVQQIELALSLPFIDAVFRTGYATRR